MVALCHALALAIEIAAAWAFWRFGSSLAPGGITSVLAGAVGAGVVIGVWWRWGAPKSPTRLRGRALLAFKVAVFALSTCFLAITGLPMAAAVLAAGSAIYLVLAPRLDIL